MRTILTIARYDLLRSFLQRETFFLGLLMPAVMMFLLGISISGSQATIYIDVINEDDSALSEQLVTLLAEEMAGDDSGFLLCAYADPNPDSDCGLDDNLANQPGEWHSTADKRIEDTTTYGVVIVEAGFGAALRAGEDATVIFKNSTDLSAPTLAMQKIDAAVSRMSGSVAVTNLVLGAAADNFEIADTAAAFDRVQAQIEAAWDTSPVVVNASGTHNSTLTGSGFQQSGPGTATMFVLIFMLNTSTMLVYERETGTLQRLYSLPARRASILAGKLLGQYAYGLLLFTALIIIGTIMGVEWGSDIPGIVLIALLFTLASTALGLALATVVRTSAQATNISLFMSLTLAPLGGGWWPLEIVPDFMRTIGHISPIAWAMDSFQELMWYDGTLVDILPNMGVLAAMTVLFFAFGVLNFKYE